MIGPGEEAESAGHSGWVRADLSGGGVSLGEGRGTVLINGGAGGRHCGDISQN